MPTAKVTKNVSAAIGGGNVLCSTLISIKTKAWLYSFGCAVSFFTAVHSCEKHPAFLSDPVSAFPYGHFFTPSFSGADTAATLSCVFCPCSIRIGMTLFDSIL